MASSDKESIDYLLVRCNGSLTQKRSASKQQVNLNVVLDAWIMNATLMLPELDCKLILADDSHFNGIYAIDQLIKYYDVWLVESILEICHNGRSKKIKTHQSRPPRDAPICWYKIEPLDKMKKQGVIYLTSFSHHLAEEKR